MSKKRPFGITIMSVIGFISAFMFTGLGLVIMLSFGALGGPNSMLAEIIGFMGSLAGIFLIGMGIIQGVLSFGLWKMQKWAWYVTIITYALSALFALTQMNVVSLVIGGLMVYYLYSVRKKF